MLRIVQWGQCRSVLLLVVDVRQVSDVRDVCRKCL